MFLGILEQSSGSPNAYLVAKSIEIVLEVKILSTLSPQVQSRAKLGVPPNLTCQTYTGGRLKACCMWHLSTLSKECAHSSHMSRATLLGHWHSINFCHLKPSARREPEQGYPRHICTIRNPERLISC